MEVDRINNVDITSPINTRDLKNLLNAGWASVDYDTLTLTEHGNFNYWIPLKMLLGFVEDYKHILTNLMQKLILCQLRLCTDNAIVNTSGTQKEPNAF